jgi:hypothetical protein
LLLRNVRLAEDLARRVMVAARTEQAEGIDRGRATECEGVAVLQGDKATLAAAAAVFVGEGALATIALPDLASDLERHVP